jgi:hypothetical protein
MKKVEFMEAGTYHWYHWYHWCHWYHWYNWCHWYHWPNPRIVEEDEEQVLKYFIQVRISIHKMGLCLVMKPLYFL